MKKVFLIIIAILGMASAKAQIKDSGLRVIGEIGLGIGTISDEGFGTINPSIECSFGANVMSQIFLGGGIGYDTQIGIIDAEGTYHEERYLHMAGITFLLTMQLLTSNLVINAISQMTQMRLKCLLDLAICSVTNTMYLLVIWVLIMTAHQFMVAQ